MATKAEIEDAIDALDEAAYACGDDVSTGFPYPRQSFVDRRRAARARLLALLAPEPEPSEQTCTANHPCTACRELQQWVDAHPPEPEPSDAEIEAAENAIGIYMGEYPSQESFDYCRNMIAKAVLTAARAARQTGGEN